MRYSNYSEYYSIALLLLMAARLRHVYRHVSSVAAATAPLGDLDAEDISSRYQRDGFVVVRNFLSGEELQRTREELFSYIENIIPDKSTEDCYFDGEWSKAGARGPVSALKYINRMDEVPRPAPPLLFVQTNTTLLALF